MHAHINMHMAHECILYNSFYSHGFKITSDILWWRLQIILHVKENDTFCRNAFTLKDRNSCCISHIALCFVNVLWLLFSWCLSRSGWSCHYVYWCEHCVIQLLLGWCCTFMKVEQNLEKLLNKWFLSDAVEWLLFLPECVVRFPSWNSIQTYYSLHKKYVKLCLGWYCLKTIDSNWDLKWSEVILHIKAYLHSCHRTFFGDKLCLDSFI